MWLLEAAARVWSHGVRLRSAVSNAAVHGSVERQSSRHRSLPDGLHAGLMAAGVDTGELTVCHFAGDEIYIYFDIVLKLYRDARLQ